MPKWVSLFERAPTHIGNYFIKYNGDKKLISLHDFSKYLEDCETFLWLDESDEDKKKIDTLLAINTIDEFCKTDYRLIAEKLIVPYMPYIPKSIVDRTFHKYYLRIIGSLRKEIVQLNKETKSSTIIIRTEETTSKTLDNGINRINNLLRSNSYF